MSQPEKPGASTLGPEAFALFDELPAYIWVAAPTGEIIFFNRVAERILGENRASLCARWMTLLHPDDVPVAARGMAESIQTGADFNAKLRYVYADGSARWFDVHCRATRDANGQIIAWLGSSTDIHDQEMALKALRESEMRYRLFAESTREGIWYWDIVTNRIDWNDRTCELFGIPPTSFAGTPDAVMERLHPSDREQTKRAIKAHLEADVPYRVEIRMRYGLSGDEYRNFIGHGLVERDENGKPIRMVGGFEDVTEYKEADALLRERLTIIERQAREISELSTPIIEVWEGVITMPLFGTIDATRAERMMQVLLEAITARQCDYAILDLTGAASMDATTAEHVGRLLTAVNLLGAKGIVVGIRPEVARTLVDLSIDISNVRMLANLREALLYVMRQSAKAKSKR